MARDAIAIARLAQRTETPARRGGSGMRISFKGRHDGRVPRWPCGRQCRPYRRARASYLRSGLECAPGRARQGHHPSRHQAGEHLRHPRRAGEGARLRAGEDGQPEPARSGGRHADRGRADHDARDRGRDSRLHVAGAGRRRTARRQDGPLLVRPRALRDGHGTAGLQREYGRRLGRHPAPAAGAGGQHQSAADAAVPADRREGARKGPRGALPVGRRAARRPQAAAARCRLGARSLRRRAAPTPRRR